MKSEDARRGSGGQGLHAALSAVQYPHLDLLTPDSLDWLYEVGSCRSFLNWLAGSLGQENYISPEELAAYERIPCNELLSGLLLEAALALDEPAGGDMTDKERERLIATLETELTTQESCLETVTGLKNQLVDQVSRESMELGRLAELGTAAEKEERREREHVMQVSSIHTACLEEVQRAVEGVVAQHRDTPEPAVFLCNIQLDQLTRSEKELDQQLVSYISSQYGASFAELDLFSETESPVSRIPDILDLEDEACLDLVRGRDRTEFDRLITEINRLRVSLYHTEISRIETAAEAAQLRAAVASLDTKRCGGGRGGGDKTTEPCLVGLNQSRAVPLLLVEGEGANSYSSCSSSLEQLRYTVAELAAETASLHCRQILATDYEVKAKRSTYVLAKLDTLCDLLLERKARQEILESLVERECVDMMEVQDSLQTLTNTLLTPIRKAEQFRTAVKSVARPQNAPDSRSLIPLEDTTLTNVHQILQISGLVGHLPTYSSVSEAVGQLEQQKTDLEQRLNQLKAARLTDLQHIAQAIRKVGRLLHLGEGSRACSLVPSQVARGISAADGGARQLEQRLKQLMTTWDRETKELAAKPHLERLRQLWVDFLVQPQVLGPNLRAIQARSKD